MSIERYVRTLRRWLGSGRRARRILCEIESHLEDDAESLRSQGFSPSTAEQRAVLRFGSPRRLASSFYLRTPLVLLERTEPLLLFASTLVTLHGAAVFLATGVLIVEAASRWSFLQPMLTAGFSLTVLLTWTALAFRKKPPVLLARAAGPWVLGLGFVGVGWATWNQLASEGRSVYLLVMNANVALMGYWMLRCFPRPDVVPAGLPVDGPRA